MVPPSGKLTLEMKRVFPAATLVVFAAFSDPEKPRQGDPFYLAGQFREGSPALLVFAFVYRTRILTTSKRWWSCRFGISARRRRSSTPRARSEGAARRALHRDGWPDRFDKLELFIWKQ